MRFWLAILPILGSITGGFAQSVPLISIAGRPFSADEVIIQNPKPNVYNVLPMKTIRVYRDSAVRTREEVSIPRDPTATQVVTIEDPVAGVHYYLDTEKKIARRLVFPPSAVPGAIPTTTASGVPDGLVVYSSKFHDVQTTSGSLGRMLIDGLAADGRRTTSVSPPIPGCDENMAVTESWYSQELRVILLQKWSNCMGDGTTRFEHMNQAEPDPLLFQMPSDYTIVD